MSPHVGWLFRDENRARTATSSLRSRRPSRRRRTSSLSTTMSLWSARCTCGKTSTGRVSRATSIASIRALTGTSTTRRTTITTTHRPRPCRATSSTCVVGPRVGGRARARGCEAVNRRACKDRTAVGAEARLVCAPADLLPRLDRQIAGAHVPAAPGSHEPRRRDVHHPVPRRPALRGPEKIPWPSARRARTSRPTRVRGARASARPPPPPRTWRSA